MKHTRNDMIAALKLHVVPKLRKKGFKGSFPHFRKINADKIDLLTFQFDRYGGGFVIEAAIYPVDGIVHEWGEIVPSNKVTAHDVSERLRLKKQDGQWFRYDIATENVYEQVALQVLNHLHKAEEYWHNSVSV